MFSKVLYQHLKANITSFGDLTISWGYGAVKDDAVQPYIVFYELDDNRDSQFLCDEHGDSGDYFLQLNIYTQPPNTDEGMFLGEVIRKTVSDYLLTLQGVTLTDGTNSYIMNNIKHDSSPSANTLTNGLAVDVLAKTINYSKN